MYDLLLLDDYLTNVLVCVIIEPVFFKKAERSEIMKPNGLLKTMMASVLTLGMITNVIYYDNINKKENVVLDSELYEPVIYEGNLVSNDLVSTEDTSSETTEETVVEEEPVEERITVYEDMTMEELAEKLDRTLSSNLSGMGYTFASYSIELGVDPYLAVAIAMHETGCTWNCSKLTKECNNVGGQKGTGCGEYQSFESLDAGIYGFVANIKNKYVDYGLLTAEAMNPKYAEDPTWSSKVNNYIEKIRNS